MVKEEKININLDIPKRSIWSLFGALVLGVFIYLQMRHYLYPSFKEILDLKPETTNMSDMGLIWIPVISYILITIEIFLVFNIFKKLKSYSEGGLIKTYYIGSLIFGSIGVLCGLCAGLIPGTLDYFFEDSSIYMLFSKVIMGLSYSITGGLMISLVSSFLVGISHERF